MVLVAKAAPNADMSLIWLFERLQSCFVRNGHTKKASMPTTHIRFFSVVLVAKAAPNTDMSLIRLHARL